MLQNWKNSLNKLSNFIVLFILFFAIKGVAEKNYRANETPKTLEEIKVIEHLGSYIDLSLVFTNEMNQKITLKQYFNDSPVLMSIIYYNCPSLCNFHLNGLFEGLNQLATSWKEPYKIVIVSMDSSEKPALAKEKKENYIREFKNLKKKNIHFLTGSPQSIKKLADSLGFAFRWDDETKQFAHSPVAYALSPKALISRYLYGIEFEPKKLKLALLEAGRGKIRNVIDRILLFCYRFNAKKNKYTLYSANIMKAGGILMILILMILLIPTWIRERRQHL